MTTFPCSRSSPCVSPGFCCPFPTETGRTSRSSEMRSCILDSMARGPFKMLKTNPLKITWTKKIALKQHNLIENQDFVNYFRSKYHQSHHWNVNALDLKIQSWVLSQIFGVKFLQIIRDYVALTGPSLRFLSWGWFFVSQKCTDLFCV